MLIRRILVPIDFSPESLAAAEVAVDLARQLGARVRVLTVLDIGDLRVALKQHLYDFKTDAEVHRAVRRWLREQSGRFVMPDDVPHTRSIRRGFVDDEILSVIRSYRPQVVVMGSRGLARRLSLGSTTAAVLRRCAVPVLVVKAPARR
jgi:nucleotide-binding universal stress UspA family protein